MKKFQAGQKVRVIADTFKADPHGLEIGSVYTIESISPATKFKELPPMMQFIFAVGGMANVDVPERIHVKTGADPMKDYANLVFDDVELVEETHDLNGKKIRMLDDDFCDGYFKGDIFEVFWSESEGEYLFKDRVGDPRPLDCHEYELV
ncbi:hypothetical protein V7128_05805 [Neobacillus vireti]|uniref:hypothetical protein n=1 Tax=Neobacillus vireti TaxID=220686 RepID=UPI002FFFCE13